MFQPNQLHHQSNSARSYAVWPYWHHGAMRGERAKWVSLQEITNLTQVAQGTLLHVQWVQWRGDTRVVSAIFRKCQNGHQRRVDAAFYGSLVSVLFHRVCILPGCHQLQIEMNSINHMETRLVVAHLVLSGICVAASCRRVEMTCENSDMESHHCILVVGYALRTQLYTYSEAEKWVC